MNTAGSSLPPHSTSTPQSALQKKGEKRDLSSPIDNTELKKQLLSESASSPSTMIVDLDASHTDKSKPDSSQTASKSNTLSTDDLKTISLVIKESFREEFLVHFEANIQYMVDKVASKLEDKFSELVNENLSIKADNEELQNRVDTLEAQVDALEQYSRKTASGCLESRKHPEKTRAPSY